MKINFLRTFVKCCFISFVGYQAYLYACASDWGYYYNSIFSPEIASNTNTYTPLFYDDAFLFYNNSYIRGFHRGDDSSEDFYQCSCEIWL